VLLLGCAFLAGEAYYRFCYDTTDSLSYTLTSRAWFRRHFVRNASGFRDAEPPSPTRDPGRRRVGFLGDSFVAGHGIARVEDRFPDLIRRAHPGWEVHLLADLGFDTGDELRLLKKLAGDGYQADLVVLVYNLNDVADIPGVWPESLQRILDAGEQRGWLRRNSYLVDTLHHRLRVARTPELAHYFGYVRDAYGGAPWTVQRQRLVALHGRVRDLGGRLLAVTFPFLHAVGAHYEFRPVHRQLGRFWRGQRVPHLDLLPLYEPLPPARLTVNRWDAHPNEYAHELAAREIGTFLEEQFAATP
jgi:hypothetical protein